MTPGCTRGRSSPALTQSEPAAPRATCAWVTRSSRAELSRPARVHRPVESVDLSLQHARRIAVRAQRLAGPRPPATSAGLMDIARSIRVIQIDSIAVAGAPTQYLVPFSR